MPQDCSRRRDRPRPRPAAHPPRTPTPSAATLAPAGNADSRAALAADAFIYGFPLVFDVQEVDRFARYGIGAVPATPFNQFGHASALAGPETRFVSVNNDTVYSTANVDTTGGPVRLDVPDSADRYYVLQFVDAWTNNFAHVGHRATGTAEGSFLLVPPGWDGEAPDDVTPVRFPTAVGTIVGRWAVNGEADLPAVRGLQSGLTLTPAKPGAIFDGTYELPPITSVS